MRSVTKATRYVQTPYGFEVVSSSLPTPNETPREPREEGGPLYPVGEHGRETFIIPSEGGYITPLKRPKKQPAEPGKE